MARVSIGVPTYNGIDFIGECLTCIRDQSFEDFEVFISDNASTDGASDICADFAREDKRFRHQRLASTIPAAQNFLRARDMTTASFFMWRADDDLADPAHLAGLVAALDAHPDAALAIAPVHRIRMVPDRKESFYPLPFPVPEDRIQRITAILLGCHPSWFYGLWRRDDVVRDWDRTLTSYPYLWASDHMAMLPAILGDRVVLVPGQHFVQRIFRQASYGLDSRQLLAARKAYASVAYAMLSEANFSSAERFRMRRVLEKHMDLRVAPYFKTSRRALKRAISAFFKRECDAPQPRNEMAQ